MFAWLREHLRISEGLGGKSNSLLKTILAAIIVLLGAVALFWSLNQFFLFYYSRSYVEEIASALGLNKHLANALVWTVFAALAIFAGNLFSFSRKRRLIGLSGLFVLLVSQSLVLFWADKPFDEKGVAQKCYVITRETIKYGERPGIDPSTGLECKLITPEIAELVEKYSHGERPLRIPNSAEPVFFSPATGRPVVWYARSATGLIELFDLMGYHPQTSEELLPVTKEVVALWNVQRRVAKRVFPDEKYSFFDPVTGKPTVWYRKADDGDFEFYDGPGFDSRTGEPLSQISVAVISDWKKYKEEHRGTPCYILTRDSVRYGTKLGIDPETGRQCRPYTPEMLERLNEYERGNRPKRIEASTPVFFDLRSGEPAVWYAKPRNGDIELFSLMGFHPDTGEELLPVTKEVAAAWTTQQSKPKRAPQRIDPKTFVFFDPLTGEPRAWYWHGPEGQWEFYDGPGYHPLTGDPLQVLTKELVLKFQKEAADQAKKQADADAAAERAEAEAAKKRAEELQKLSQSEKQCDLLAANPNDQRRVGEGVPFEALKLQAKEAVEACENAIRQNQRDLRLQYQLARALQFVDRKRSLSILQKLVAAKYPAAFDNIGWIYFSDLKNIEAAVNYFRAGVDLNDSDSMLSLAEMVDRNYTFPRTPAETKLALYHRAAELGNAAGAKAEQVELQKQGIEQQNREIQLQQARMAGQMFNLILQGMPRR